MKRKAREMRSKYRYLGFKEDEIDDLLSAIGCNEGIVFRKTTKNNKNKKRKGRRFKWLKLF